MIKQGFLEANSFGIIKLDLLLSIFLLLENQVGLPIFNMLFYNADYRYLSRPAIYKVALPITLAYQPVTTSISSARN
ncbi:hypothetical protein CJF32_00010786 [Rutstroemia sp. NJR-2017a WRK4]|nr:hypothetical protein CJF32_00010786 [Rutstroemia sp. NJR-2017a WRK4]